MADYTSLYSGAAITASGNGSAIQTPLGATVAVNIVVSAAPGTSPSITFEIQWSNDGVNWASADATPDTFAAIIAVKNVAKNVTVKGGMMRLAWTTSGSGLGFATVATAVEIPAERY